MVRHATTDGTAQYRARFLERLHPSHFGLRNGLWFSSVGAGVHLKDGDAAAAEGCREALAAAVASGCNHIDAANTHRSDLNERVVGQMLAAAFARGSVARNEVIVAARGGYVLFSDSYPEEAAAYVSTRLIDAGIAAADEFARGWHHCISARHLRMQFRRCLTNLGLGAVDIYYVHDPEAQRAERGPEIFERRMLAAFAELESQIRAERLASYGVASRDGFRVTPVDSSHLSLARLVELAREAGGDGHHFRYVQAPLSLAERETMVHMNQVVDGRRMTLVEAAQELGIVVIGGATLWRGQLALHVPERVQAAFPEAQTKAQAAIQFSRSAPGVASALVGMSSREHVAENLAVARWPRATIARLAALLRQ